MADIKLSTRTEFDSTIEKGVTLVDFNADWCGPCRAQDPIISELGDVYEGRARVAKVNIDENRDVALTLGIHSIPTIIIFKEGKEINRFVGLQNAKTLNKVLSEIID